MYALIVGMILNLINNWVSVQNRLAAAVTINNSAALTTIYSFLVPGGLLGTSRKLRLTLDGTYDNSLAGPTSANVQMILTYGATSIPVLSLTLGVGAWKAIFEITNVGGAPNEQMMTGVLVESSPYNGALDPSQAVAGVKAFEDSSTPLTLGVTIQLSAASVNLTFVTLTGTLELV